MKIVDVIFGQPCLTPKWIQYLVKYTYFTKAIIYGYMHGESNEDYEAGSTVIAAKNTVAFTAERK